MPREHRVVLVAYDGAEILDVTGPASVFSAASHLGARPRYRLEVAAPQAGWVTTSSGLVLRADRALGALRGPIDTLVVAGGPDTMVPQRAPQLAAAIGRVARRSRRVASVCSGALLLAQAGLLDGRRVTTHWAASAGMRAAYPACRVDESCIFVRDGDVWTSAGVTAGMDLCLALVEEDHSRDLALSIARMLVLYLRRPGGQSQFSVPLAAQEAERGPIRALQLWIVEHLGGDLSVEALARRAGMSARNFARVFREEVGITPGAYVEAARLEGARRALESTVRTVKEIALDCGFGTVETMHRVFQRELQTTPREYRRRFESTAAPAPERRSRAARGRSLVA